MNPWTQKHWLLLGGFLTALAVQISGLDHWNDAVKPSFVAGFLGQLGAMLAAIYTDKPKEN